MQSFDWATRFEATVRDLIAQDDDPPLVDYKSRGPDAELSAPTPPQHYLSLPYMLGAKRDGDVCGARGKEIY